MTAIPFECLSHAFNRARLTYDDAAVLPQMMAEELLSRLPLLTFQPELIVDLGQAQEK